MFLPSEAVYSELHANFRNVVEESFKRRVWIVSPTTLMATLNTVRAILKDAEIVSTLPNIYGREQIEEFVGASECADVSPEDAARVEALFESNYGLPREQEAAVPSSR